MIILNENNNITYDENWQSVSEAEYPVIASSDFEDEISDSDIPKEKKQSEIRQVNFL